LKKNLFIVVAFFSIFFSITGCGIYSFNGASIPPDAKTISIAYFQNEADMVQPVLSQKFTDALKDKFSSQTKLNLINTGGDLNLEGEIISYQIAPIAIQGDQTAALNRLTITVKVRFTNTKNPSSDFETSFSRYTDYDSSKNLSDIEESLIETINEMLIDDIFNKAVVNW